MKNLKESINSARNILKTQQRNAEQGEEGKAHSKRNQPGIVSKEGDCIKKIIVASIIH